MNLKERLTNASPGSLRNLLILSAEPDDGSDIEREDQCLSRHVEALLAEPAPLVLSDQAARSTGECLLDRDQPVSAFRLLKDHFKKGAVACPTEARADAARVLYYAAIAAAMVFHGTVITSIPILDCDQALEYLSGSAGVPPSLVGLFHKAAEMARSKVHSE